MGSGERKVLFTLRRRKALATPDSAFSELPACNENHAGSSEEKGEQGCKCKLLMTKGCGRLLRRGLGKRLTGRGKEQPDGRKTLNEGAVTVNQKSISSGTF
jgi:hypothetical protein